MTLRYPDNPLDVFLADLKRRGRLAKAPQRRRPQRIAKKIAKRGGFLRFPKPSDEPPEHIAKIARVTVGVAAVLEDESKFDEPMSADEIDEFDRAFEGTP